MGGDPQALRGQLKEMAKRGLITAGRAATGGLGFGVMPFVVGIYEMQAGRIDAELAQLFEAYYLRSYRRSLAAAAARASRDPGGPDRAQRHGGASL